MAKKKKIIKYRRIKNNEIACKLWCDRKRKQMVYNIVYENIK